jgi:GNAT superfamily N-acetyltransferase
MPVAEPRVPDPQRLIETRFLTLQAALFESMVVATPSSQRARLGLRHESDGAFSVLACDASRHLMLNRVADIAGAPPLDVARLAAALGRARRDSYLVQLPAHAEPADLAGLGLVPFRRDWLVLARPLSPAAPVATRFRLAPATRADGPAFGEIMAGAFGMSEELVPCSAGIVEHPAWHTYVAFDDTELVAGASLFVHERTAYLGMAATRPSHRGAGAHDALIALRIEQARRLGCDLLLAETGAPVPGEPSPSLNNMLSAGFEPALVRKNFAPPGATWTGR